jgi:SpoVK/Ycf46/Vps4 family AAA+-type ATPase
VARDLSVLASRIIGNALLRQKGNDSSVSILSTQLQNLAISGLSTAVSEPIVKISWSLDVVKALETIGASQKVDSGFDAQKPDVSWDAIKGYDEVKRKLQMFGTLPLERPDLFEKLGVKPPSGILLYGPTGTSSKMLM